MQAALKQIGVSWTEHSLVLTLPPASTHLGRHIAALGGSPIAETNGQCFALAPPSRTNAYALIEALRDIEEIVAPPVAKCARQAVAAPHPGIALTTDGATLEMRAADMPLRNLVLRDLQPVYRTDGTIAVRLDIQQPGAITEALGKLAGYYSGLLVPPTSPDNGLAISEAQLAGWEQSPAASLATAWSPAADAMRMIERQFGQSNGSAETAASRGIDPGVVERLGKFADRVGAARQQMAWEDTVRSRRR